MLNWCPVIFSIRRSRGESLTKHVYQVSCSGSNADFGAIYVSSEGSDKSAHLHSLAWAFVTAQVPSLMCWLKLWSWRTCVSREGPDKSSHLHSLAWAFFHSTCTKSHVLAQRRSWHNYVSREGSDKPVGLNSLTWAFFTVHELILMFWLKNSKWLWSGYSTITNCRQTRGIVRKSHTTIMRHQEDKQSKQPALSSPSRWLQHRVTHKQNIEQLQNPTMGVTINNESTTTTEPPP